jgi:hypothetical protein
MILMADVDSIIRDKVIVIVCMLEDWSWLASLVLIPSDGVLSTTPSMTRQLATRLLHSVCKAI